MGVFTTANSSHNPLLLSSYQKTHSQLTYSKNGNLKKVLGGDETLLWLIDHEAAEAQGPRHDAETQEALEEDHRVQTLVLRRLLSDVCKEWLHAVSPGVINKTFLIGHRCLKSYGCFRLDVTFPIRRMKLAVSPAYIYFIHWDLQLGLILQVKMQEQT